MTEQTNEERAISLFSQEVESAWDDLLATESGRLVVWSILDKCGLNDFTFYGDGLDAVNRGRQQVGSEIQRDYVFPKGVAVYASILMEAEKRQDTIRLAIEADEKEMEGMDE